MDFITDERIRTDSVRVGGLARLWSGGPCGECSHEVTVRVGVAEEDFEGVFFGSHFLNREAREEREGKPLNIFADLALTSTSSVQAWRLIFPTQTLYFVERRVHAVFGQAGPFGESAHGVTVRVGMAEAVP